MAARLIESFKCNNCSVIKQNLLAMIGHMSKNHNLGEENKSFKITRGKHCTTCGEFLKTKTTPEVHAQVCNKIIAVRPKRSYYSAKYKKELVEKYESSGLSLGEFAAKVGVHPLKLKEWIKQSWRTLKTGNNPPLASDGGDMANVRSRKNVGGNSSSVPDCSLNVDLLKAILKEKRLEREQEYEFKNKFIKRVKSISTILCQMPIEDDEKMDND